MQLQIDLAAAAIGRAFGKQAAEQADAGPMFGLQAEHQAQEAVIVTGGIGGERAQLIRQGAGAVNATEVEEDLAEQQRGRHPAAHPQRHLPPPLRQGLAPDRVGRHHPAVAEREVQAVEGR